MRRGLMTICFAALVVSGALAQQKKSVPPPPKPKDAGPSLEVTMKFIQDKVNAVGPVNYAAYYHENAVGAGVSDWTAQFGNEASNMVADAGACRISYHWTTRTENGQIASDLDTGFSLKDVQDIAVMPMEQLHKEVDTVAGHPSWSCRIDPPVFALKVRITDTAGFKNFDFSDEQLANRVAKAMLHAVELCGGGSKPEPF
jgi:hypothetical protein